MEGGQPPSTSSLRRVRWLLRTFRHRYTRRASFLNDPKVRSLSSGRRHRSAVASIWWMVDNTIENLNRLNISLGLRLPERPGRSISPTVLSRSARPTYARARSLEYRPRCRRRHHYGQRNSFVIGIGRLSHNWLIRKIHGLCRDFPQYPAAAGLLLVFRRAVASRCRVTASNCRSARSEQSRPYFPRPVWATAPG